MKPKTRLSRGILSILASLALAMSFMPAAAFADVGGGGESGNGLSAQETTDSVSKAYTLTGPVKENLKAGKQYIFIGKDADGKSYAMSSDAATTSNKLAAVELSVADGVASFSSSEAAAPCVWSAESASTGCYLKSNGKYLKHYYAQVTSTDAKSSASDIAYSGDKYGFRDAGLSSTASQTLVFNTGNKYFGAVAYNATAHASNNLLIAYEVSPKADGKQPDSSSVVPPEAVTGVAYNGEAQTVVSSGTGYTLAFADGSPKDAGIDASGNATLVYPTISDVTVIATLDNGCTWSDDSTEPKNIAVSVAKGDNPAITTKPARVSMLDTDPARDLTASYSGAGELSVESANETVATVAIKDKTIAITPVGIGDTSITVTAAAGDYYTAASTYEIPVSVADHNNLDIYAEQVTSIDEIVTGAKYVFTNVDNTYAMTAQGDGAAVGKASISEEEGKISFESSAELITSELSAERSDSTFSFSSSDGYGLLVAAASVKLASDGAGTALAMQANSVKPGIRTNSQITTNMYAYLAYLSTNKFSGTASGTTIPATGVKVWKVVAGPQAPDTTALEASITAAKAYDGIAVADVASGIAKDKPYMTTAQRTAIDEALAAAESLVKDPTTNAAVADAKTMLDAAVKAYTDNADTQKGAAEVPKDNVKTNGGVAAEGGVFSNKPANSDSLELKVANESSDKTAVDAAVKNAGTAIASTDNVNAVFEVDLVNHLTNGASENMTEGVGALTLTFPVEGMKAGDKAKVVQLHETTQGNAPEVIVYSGDKAVAADNSVTVTLDGKLSTFIVATEKADENSGKADDTKKDDAKTVKMFRLYNPNSGEHFYTGDASEHDYLVGLGWSDEGTGWTAPEKSDTPVYRLYNANGGEHHYTMDADEKEWLESIGWKYESVGWYSDDAKTTVLYREYNPNAFSNNHNYTTDKEEHDWLLSIGWNDEGTAWYGVAAE